MNTSVLHQILDLARWAPSGDNTQPWRFEIVDERHVVIHGRDTRDHCVYDLDGHPSQISLGALIETLAIAASRHSLVTSAARRPGLPETCPTFDVTLAPSPNLLADPLISAIPRRSVQRRPLSTRELTAHEQHQLEAAVGPNHELVWAAGWRNRMRWASLLWHNAGLRLRLPEAFDTHRSIIQWHARFSDDRIPDQALGADALTVVLMRHAMQSWGRIEFMNKYLGGTIVPRLQMDLLPALACAAHVAIVARQTPNSVDDYVAAGRAVQRFWLTATQLGLQHQPEMTPLIFSRYVREGRRFTAQPALQALAQKLAGRLRILLPQRADRTIWLGRVGEGAAASARSERLALRELVINTSDSAEIDRRKI